MRRKQVYIDDDLDHALKALARRSNEAEAVHVRRALRAYVEKEDAERAQVPDPLLDLVGMVDDDEGPDDVAEHHDRYLYGSPRTDR